MCGPKPWQFGIMAICRRERWIMIVWGKWQNAAPTPECGSTICSDNVFYAIFRDINMRKVIIELKNTGNTFICDTIYYICICLHWFGYCSWVKYQLSKFVGRLLYPLSLGDTIWRHRYESTLAQVMACCLTAPSHYMNQCWFIIKGVHGVHLRRIHKKCSCA